MTQMVDFLVLVANGIRTSGATTTVQVDDTWPHPAAGRADRTDRALRAARVPSSTGARYGDCCAAPCVRLPRRSPTGNSPETSNSPEDQPSVRAAAMLTLANSLDRELVSTALRGLDPLLLAGWDQLTLLVDGQCKPVLGSVLGA